MTININVRHIHHGVHDELELINKKISIIMGKLEEIQTQLGNIQSSADNIAADIERLIGKITGGLTSDEANVVITDLTAIADKLKGIADINPE